MRFLPIVERELRVAARQRRTYVSRWIVAFFAIFIGVIIFLVTFNSPPATISNAIFVGLSILCLCYCILSGRISTADCISEEKREGTLGLLFLTDLKGYDIVLGKLVSTSLGALYGLLAVFPVLALPLLMGGVSNNEFWRMALVLVTTFLYSLAIGIFGSAISHDIRRTMAANFALAIFFMGVLPFGIFGLIYYFTGIQQLKVLLTCPGYAFYLTDDTTYRLTPQFFWYSVGTMGGIAVSLLTLACIVVPRTWQERPVVGNRQKRITWRGFWRLISFGREAKLAPFRKQLLDQNAFYWLIARARLKPAHVWIFLLLMAVWWVIGWLRSGLLWFDGVTMFTMALILNGALKSWITLEASQQLAEDQRAGALELILVTPITERDIVRGQYLAWRRQFLKPLIVTILVELIFMAQALTDGRYNDRELAPWIWIPGIAMLVTDALTIPLAAMRNALTAKTPSRAVLLTVTWILFFPWALFGLVLAFVCLGIGLFTPMNRAPDFPGERGCILIWLGTGLVVDAFFAARAWRQLTANFRQLALWRTAPTPISTDQKARVASWLKIRQFLLKRKKWAIASFCLLVAGSYMTWQHRQPDYPAPLTVYLTKRTASPFFSGSRRSLFILPDGTLWQWGEEDPFKSKRIPIPTQFDSGNWREVATTVGCIAAIGADGSLWQWAKPITYEADARWVVIDRGHDWTHIISQPNYLVATKKDGTLWKWLYNSVPTQLNADTDWKDVRANWLVGIGLKTNGTIWDWNMTQRPSIRGSLQPALISTPVQLGSRSDWICLDGGGETPVFAWDSKSNLWQLDLGYNLTTPIPTLIATNIPPHNVAVGYGDQAQIVILKSDGTLWRKFGSSWHIFNLASNDPWKQIGNRSDWESIWSSGGTIFGLTRDGTLWTWGLDSSRDGRWTLADRWKIFQKAVQSSLSKSPPPWGRYNKWGLQKDPRPLLQLTDSPTPRPPR